MRKTTIVALVLALVAGGIVAALMVLPNLGQSGTVRTLSMAFMEDLQFKDFRSSSLYTHPLERDRVDMGQALERLFLVKPEFLDIRQFDIVKLDVDEDKRARVLIRTVFQRLNVKKEPEEGEVVLYFIKRHPDCPLGATCGAGGECLNEFGDPARRSEKTEEEEKEEKKKLEKTPGYEVAKAKGDTYACSPKDHEWYMNLDSTLKEKKYNN